MTDKPIPHLIKRSGIRHFASSPREAYEKGVPLDILRGWFHLSDSEARDVAPEEFEDADMGQNKVSGY